MAAAASDEFPAATDVADLLVRRGMPFRECHGVVAALVKRARRQRPHAHRAAPGGAGRALRAARRGVLPRAAPASWLESKDSEGGTSLRRVREQLARARARLARATPTRPLLAAASFYDRPVLDVARDLVGCVVAHAGTSGVIVETEAYHDSEPACHAFVGLTARTETLFGPPGRAYVYRSYGIHALLNAVCEPEGVGAAVLIRALSRWRGSS